MESFRFAHPEYFYFLLVIPVFIIVFVLARIDRRRSLQKFGSSSILEQLMPNVSSGRPLIKFVVWMLALFFIITAIAQPQFGSKLKTEKRKGVELVIALDVSNSMLAEDIKPNRLERAKRAISKLTERLVDDKIGLIVFAGEAYTQLPVTVDYASAKLFLNSIDTDIVPVQGTAIGAAINLGIRSFSPDFEGNKAIIVITDGENHEDDAVGMAEKAAENGIIVHAIGMGLPQGAPIPVLLPGGQRDYRKGEDGNTVVTKLNEEMLSKISAAGGGTYVRANNAQVGLSSLFNEIEKMEEAELESRIYSEYEDQFPIFIALGLLLIFIDFLILERKNKWLKNFKLFGR
jgi:Ca-activated chloride channel family protein